MISLCVSPVTIYGHPVPSLFFRILMQLFMYLFIRRLLLFEPPLSGSVLGARVGVPRTPFCRPRGSRAQPCRVVAALHNPVKKFHGAQGIHALLLGSFQGIHIILGVTQVTAVSGRGLGIPSINANVRARLLHHLPLDVPANLGNRCRRPDSPTAPIATNDTSQAKLLRSRLRKLLRTRLILSQTSRAHISSGPLRTLEATAQY